MGALVLASCSKKVDPVQQETTIVNPLADYTVTPDANDGFTFKYNNLSKNFSKLEWRFGDDTLNTTDSPTHTFLTTGKFTTDLKVFSSTGTFSHKYVDINIVPDSVLKVTAEKTGNPLELKVSFVFKGTAAHSTWTFNDVDPTNSKTTKVTYTDQQTVTRTFLYGSFNSFSVTVTSDKGSTATISRNITPDGIATDITQSRIAWNSTNENTVQGPNEGAAKLIDGNPDTKFGFYSAFPVPEIFTLQFASAVTVKLYAIENGNDSNSSRDPKEWNLEASQDGQTWDIIDHQLLTIGFADYLNSIGQGATKYKRFFYYPIANPKPYSWYRWHIISTFQTAFQIEEFRLYK
ncbi:hypothetical protein GCM10022392_34030 [Mucilaginibacter panaciglaebae]|uniref:PKD domain-containing protein n=2 Tax=Mucilaginibacter panaciglaebae TaxID=502331 RepID=A0ABP7X5S6_9SPHI